MMHKYIIKVHVFQAYDLPEDQVNGASIRRPRFLFEVVKEDFEEAKKVWAYLQEECALPNCTISLTHFTTSLECKLMKVQKFGHDGAKLGSLIFLPEEV